MNYLLYIKALHIIFVITWFAGLFYMVRLFVYHAEAAHDEESGKEILIRHFKGAQYRLWYGITWPSAILTWIFGLTLAYQFYGLDFPAWLQVKFLFVIGLTLYHLWCGKIFSEFRKDSIRWPGMALRIWNEVATVFMVAIVFVVVLKDSMSWINGVLGLVVFSAILMVAIRSYKRLRGK